MHYFDKDQKKTEKKFWKEQWDFDDDSKRSTTQYVNKEVEMWQSQLR